MDRAEKRRVRKYGVWKLVLGLFAVVVFSVFFSGVVSERFEKTIVIVRNGLEMELRGVGDSVGDILREHEVEIGEGDFVEPALSTVAVSGMKVYFKPAKRVLVVGPEGEGEVVTQAETVREFLEEIGFELSASRKVRPEPEILLEDSTKVELIFYDEQEERVVRTIPYKVKYQTNGDKPFGYSAVVQEGKRGKKEERYLLVYENEDMISKELVETVILENPQSKIIEKGSKIVAGQKLGLSKASFYADFFHGRKTASGDIFRNDRLTAAHKSLPFGTLVRVTNQRNGKSIVVPITDRGPYIEGRTIDLSKAAFAAIAPISNGVIPVELEIVR